ncbi:hypothetical protein Zmor_013721 [Zophobas morio]|uniref:Gustatory receptor n=1 Tax=Zophobas morio TaxID=2755281 RepID=A0AA38IDF8_9CUCU|nr:hypothetical protein Zmor_013721 [Zophobas morio]
MKFSLNLLKIFGFFPLYGICKSSNTLKFSWLSLRTLYSLFWFICLCLYSSIEIYKVFFVDQSMKQTSVAAFYISGILCHILFIKLARNWPKLMNEWHNTEETMGITGITINLRKKLQILSTTFIFLAAAEHILIKWYIFREIARKYDSALWTKQALVYMHYYTFCHITQYSLWKGIFFQIITIRSTFSWTFIDVFIMLVTTAFALRVKQFTFKVEILAKSKANNIKLWKKLRQEYYQLYQLCCLLNNKLTYIIFLSYGTNMYFILMQLFGSMKHLTSTLRKVYYYMSFFLLIARLLGVTLFGASVSNESGKILPLLFSVPSPSYNKEVERLIDQVTKNEIVISVMNFFKVNKALLFKFTGVLVTYELALMQFNTYSLNTDETVEDDRCWLFTNTNAVIVTKILSISFYAAALYEEHSKIQAYILSVPLSLYNLEICRLTNQVLYVEIAITGSRFFTVRKRTVLTIAGFVATYQLVLKHLNTQIIPNFNVVSNTNKTGYPKN